MTKARNIGPHQDVWMAAMRRGDHHAAWAIADQVLLVRDPATRDDPAQPYHRRWVWDGTRPDGRDVLVRCYHGLGDTLQFVRFLPALRARAARVTLEVQPELLPLLASVAGADRVIPFIQHAPAPPSSCDMEIMELSHALRLMPDAAPPPYLRATPRAIPPGTIGLCWESGGWEPARSIPFDALAPLLDCGHPLMCLQPRPAPPGFINPAGCPADIAETAGVIAALERVITVDSMIAHLAGALGRPTWLLLRHEADWRWMAETERSSWYPSMRLFRQSAPGEWDQVIEEAAGRLGKRSRSPHSVDGGSGGAGAGPPRG